MTGLHW